MKKRTWIILIGLLVVAIAATAVALLLPDSVDDEEVKVGLYWNIEQVQYEDPFTGQTRRTADSEGDYHLLMSVEGQQVKLTCKDTELVDKIDIILSEYYSLTEEELDFIINYDIKYRMGDELNE